MDLSTIITELRQELRRIEHLIAVIEGFDVPETHEGAGKRPRARKKRATRKGGTQGSRQGRATHDRRPAANENASE